MADTLDLAAVRARAAAARDLVTRLKLAGNLTDTGEAETLYIVIGDLERTLGRLESADRLHRADHARVAELEQAARDAYRTFEDLPDWPGDDARWQDKAAVSDDHQQNGWYMVHLGALVGLGPLAPTATGGERRG